MLKSSASKFLTVFGLVAVVAITGFFFYKGGFSNFKNPINLAKKVVTSEEKCLRYFDPFEQVSEDSFNHIAKEICVGDELKVNPVLWKMVDKDNYGAVVYVVQQMSEEHAVLKLKARQKFVTDKSVNSLPEFDQAEEGEETVLLTIGSGSTVCAPAPVRNVDIETLFEYCYEYNPSVGIVMNIRKLKIEPIPDAADVTVSEVDVAELEEQQAGDVPEFVPVEDTGIIPQ